jgi:hypothetical protein
MRELSEQDDNRAAAVTATKVLMLTPKPRHGAQCGEGPRCSGFGDRDRGAADAPNDG